MIDSRLMKNPAVFTTERVRFTIAPAISVALGTLKDLKTLNALGATAALKNIAAPSHAAISNTLILLSVLLMNRSRRVRVVAISAEDQSGEALTRADPRQSITTRGNGRVVAGS